MVNFQTCLDCFINKWYPAVSLFMRDILMLILMACHNGALQTLWWSRLLLEPQKLSLIFGLVGTAFLLVSVLLYYFPISLFSSSDLCRVCVKITFSSLLD